MKIWVLHIAQQASVEVPYPRTAVISATNRVVCDALKLAIVDMDMNGEPMIIKADQFLGSETWGDILVSFIEKYSGSTHIVMALLPKDGIKIYNEAEMGKPRKSLEKILVAIINELLLTHQSGPRCIICPNNLAEHNSDLKRAALTAEQIMTSRRKCWGGSSH